MRRYVIIPQPVKKSVKRIILNLSRNNTYEQKKVLLKIGYFVEVLISLIITLCPRNLMVHSQDVIKLL